MYTMLGNLCCLVGRPALANACAVEVSLLVSVVLLSNELDTLFYCRNLSSVQFPTDCGVQKCQEPTCKHYLMFAPAVSHTRFFSQ